jgi:hypothetical protein
LSEQKRRERKKSGKMVRFEYCKVKTNEGNWVLHVIFRGEYIPQEWLSKTWEELHGAKIVYIEKLYGNSEDSWVFGYSIFELARGNLHSYELFLWLGLSGFCESVGIIFGKSWARKKVC